MNFFRKSYRIFIFLIYTIVCFLSINSNISANEQPQSLNNQNEQVDVQNLFKKMLLANNKLSYYYSFIYKNLDTIESFSYQHVNYQDHIYSYLRRKNGNLQEILQKQDNIYYKIDDQTPFFIKGSHIYDILPQILFIKDNSFFDFYDITYLGNDRIADHLTNILMISNKNTKQLYKYKLWIDQESNLLLKSELLDENNDILNTFFIIDMDLKIDKNEFINDINKIDLSKVKQKNATQINNYHDKWKSIDLPSGFIETSSRKIRLDNNQDINMKMFCDSLFCFSVYVSDSSLKTTPILRNNNNSETLYNTVVNNYDITVIGEIPFELNKKITESIRIK